ncbi:hypothetical protein [Embleya sp. NPDC005971]|uniref:hypothetical protein n=1 Tax=Embleya sp. NPDC005971 TaxID=3156724 RepID=UPI0033E67A56
MDESPVFQSEAAKARRDLAGELSALTDGEHSLHGAEWYPARIGDVLTIRYAAGGSVPACEETYEVVKGEFGELTLTLRSHTFPKWFAGSAGAYARECTPDDPFFGPWMEAGPRKMTIARNGTVVHGGS